MKNFPVIVDGKEYWISRSVATVGFIFTFNNGLLVLAVKRGKGAPDNIGKWCAPCGYLDFDESLKQCCTREIFEETNLKVSPDILQPFGIDDVPKGRQNITHRFWNFNQAYIYQTVYAKGTEPDETEDAKWIPISDINHYDWAFGHKRHIACLVWDYLNKYLKIAEKQLLKNIVYHIEQEDA